MKMVMIYTSCGTTDEATKIANALIEKSLAACVHVMSPTTSVYRWEGKIETQVETPVIAKTFATHQAEAVKVIQTMHSYQTPEIVCWDAESLHADYSEWMKENLKDFV